MNQTIRNLNEQRNNRTIIGAEFVSNDQFNKTYSNLLNFQSGADLKKQKERIDRERQASVFGAATPTNFGAASGARNQGFAAAAAQQELPKEDPLAGFAVNMTEEQKLRIMQHQLRVEQKMRQRVEAREKHLERLNACRSAERPARTMAQQAADPFHFNYRSQNAEEGSSLMYRLRQNSMSSIDLQSFLAHNKFINQIRQAQSSAKTSLLLLRDFVCELQNAQDQGHLYLIMVGETLGYIDYFLDAANEEILQIKTIDELVKHFERLKARLSLKTEQAKQAAEDEEQKESAQYALSQAEISNLKRVYVHLQFVISNFAIILEYIRRLNTGWKANMVSIQMNQDTMIDMNSTKLPPSIMQIIKEKKYERELGSSEQTTKQSLMQRIKNFAPNERLMHKSRVLSLNLANPKPLSDNEFVDLKKILDEFPIQAMIYYIKRHHKQTRVKMAKEYQLARTRTVPKVVCRICDLEFFADKLKGHNKYCEARAQKKLAMQRINEELSRLSSEAFQARF